MPSDIRMPDGTIIRNVPDGTPRAEIERKWKIAASQKNPQRTAPQSAVAGAGHGLTFGFLDELGAVADTIGLPAGEKRPTIWNGSSFGDAWRANQRRNNEILKDAEKQNPKSYMAGEVAGMIAPALITGGGSTAASGGRLAARVPRLARAARAVVPAVAQGAAYGAGSTNGGLGARARGAAEGAAWGLGGDLAGRAVGKVASRIIGGKKVPANVRRLADEGIVLTPGQRAGPGSLRNKFEDTVLGSLPWVKEVPAAAARRGENDLRVAVANRVLKPIGQKLDRGSPINSKTIGGIQDMVGNAYDEAIAPLSLQLDDDIMRSLDDIIGGAEREVGPDGARQVAAYAEHLKGRLAEGMTGEPLKREIQALRGVASETGKKDPMLGQRFWALHNTLDDGLARQSGETASDAYRSARESSTLMSRMNDAAAKSVNSEFGPTQLLQAARRRGYGTNTANIANNDARLMDLANDAASVMRNKTANSGTPERLAGIGLLGGGVGGAAMIDPVMGSAVGASLLGYIPGLDRVLQNAALNRPQSMRAAAEAIERNKRILGLLGSGSALSLYGQ